jgi:uncharacterized membrane protein YphA (DoxX/SURF4 family)
MASPTRPLPTARWLRSDRLDRLDRYITTWLASSSITLLRVASGLLFIWFGALKFIAGASPAEDLATRTIDTMTLGLIGPSLSLPLLAGWEVLIGIGLVTGWFLRATLALLALQMVGALSPLLLFPNETFAAGLLVPTLEGQYIIKNVVIIAAAMVIGATVRGGRLEPEPERRSNGRNASG